MRNRACYFVITLFISVSLGKAIRAQATQRKQPERSFPQQSNPSDVAVKPRTKHPLNSRKKPILASQRKARRSIDQQSDNQNGQLPTLLASQEKEILERKTFDDVTVEVRNTNVKHCRETGEQDVSVVFQKGEDSWTQSYHAAGCFRGIHIVNLDEDKDKEIVLNFHTGGNGCCGITQIADPEEQGASRGYELFEITWNTHGYQFEDLDKDGALEFVTGDGDFDYQFASGAYSGLPISIWKYRNQHHKQQIVNVTRQFPQAIDKDAKQQLQKYEEAKASGGGLGGFLAAYLADMYMLGKADEGWATVAAAYAGQGKRNYLEYFVGLHNFLIQKGYANGVDFDAVASRLRGYVGYLLSKGDYGAGLRITDAILIISPQDTAAYESTLETIFGLFAINDIRNFLTKELPEISPTLRGIIQKAKDKWQARGEQRSRVTRAGEEGSGLNVRVDDAGNIKWPPNRGFVGQPVKKTLQPGTRIDRYGRDDGTFVSPQGTPYENRALPSGSDQKPYNVYEILKPVEVNSGKIAPWFGHPGGGIQYEFSQPINKLIEDGVIKRVNF